MRQAAEPLAVVSPRSSHMERMQVCRPQIAKAPSSSLAQAHQADEHLLALHRAVMKKWMFDWTTMNKSRVVWLE